MPSGESELTRPVNIAAIVPYGIFPAKMGGQKGIALFYKYLSKITPVTLISTPNTEVPPEFTNHFVPLLNSGRIRYINPLLFFSLAREIKKQNFTHLVLEHPYFGWLGLLLKRRTGIKLIVHSHNIESLRFKSTKKWWWKILRSYEKKLHRKADSNFFITEDDRKYAIENFGLEPARCHTITYGFERNKPPASTEKLEARKILEQTHGIGSNEMILFFNGTLSYPPNLEAVDVILTAINPILLSAKDFHYRIIICGKGLPPAYEELKQFADRNIIYAGFVEDIDVYFKGADVFINPVTGGGGIKTKLVEALGMNVTAVSSVSGAIGVPEQITGNKMLMVADGDWNTFAEKIINADTKGNISQRFYQHFYWGSIAEKAASIIQRL